MKNVGKNAVRNCDLTAVKRGENAKFVGTNAPNGASFKGLRSVGFAVFNGAGGCPLNKVKLKDNCKFYLQSELFNNSQEFSRHRNGATAAAAVARGGLTQERLSGENAESSGSKTLNNTNSQLHNTAFNSIKNSNSVLNIGTAAGVADAASGNKFGFDNFAGDSRNGLAYEARNTKIQNTKTKFVANSASCGEWQKSNSVLTTSQNSNLTSDAVGERAQGAELVARFMAQTALNPQKASWWQLNARLRNFAEFAAARRAAEFSTRYGGGWQNGEASGRVAVLNGGAANSAGENKFGFCNFAGGGLVSVAGAEAGAANSTNFTKSQNPQNSNLTFKANATDLVAYKNSLLEKNFAALSLRNAVGEVTRFCKWLAKVGAWEGDAEWLEHFKAGKNEGAAKEIGVVLNVEQVKKLLEWLSTQENENFKVLFNYLVIAFNTGARTGEILALKITDFNFESQKVTFNKTVVSRKSGSVSHNTKTGASRSLQVSVSVLEAAKRQIQLSKSGEGFLFTNKSGQTFENGTTLSGFYYKACKAALGVTNTRLYNTRHAFVTNSINRDFNNVAAVSKIVGHAKISTTLDNYYATAGELNAAEVSPF